MEQRVSLITLGVADLDRARGFYTRLGWHSSTPPEQGVAFFQTGCMIVALWSRAELAADSGVVDGGGWGGVTLAHNVGSPEAVDEVIEQARAAGAAIRARGRAHLLGRLLGSVRRPRRPSLGGRPQPRLAAGRGRLDRARVAAGPESAVARDW